MTRNEFNTKYKDYIEKGFENRGLEFESIEIIKFLDNIFQDLIKLKDFSFSIIKVKFNWYCFYCNGISNELRTSIEQRMLQIEPLD